MAQIEDPTMVGLSGMATNGRQPMGTEALTAMVNRSMESSAHGILHPKYSSPANDPAYFPVARPDNVLIGENGGARYGINVSMPVPVMPEAGPTTANGRVINPGFNRGRRGPFWDQ